MQNSYIQAILAFTPPVIAGIFYLKALNAYMKLYRKKIDPDYPIMPQEISTYFYQGSIDKIFISPFMTLGIIFAEHKDKELAAAVKKVRMFYLAYMGVSFLMLLILFLLIFTLN